MLKYMFIAPFRFGLFAAIFSSGKGFPLVSLVQN